MEEYTIAESYTLPSLGKVYKQQVNPNVKIRSMTTMEEMQRLSKSDRPYKVIADIIDKCLVEKPGISSYDMCVGDYQFLLHKLRIVTYGSDYKISTICPYCGNISNRVINLEEIEVKEYSADLDKYFNVVLPKTKKNIRLKMQTPRMLDDISVRKAEMLNKNPDFQGDPAFLLTIESLIDTVDGEVLDPMRLDTFIRSLNMMDANVILKSAEKINSKIGIDMVIKNKCTNPKCGVAFNSVFPITSEFFGPAID